MGLQFIDNLYNITDEQLQDAYSSGRYLAFGASMYFIFFGGAMSISSMIGGILKQTFSQSSRVKLTLMSGLIFCSALVKTLYREHLTSFDPFDTLKYTQGTSAVRLILAGLLVGFGSQYAVKGSNNSFSLDGIPSVSVKSVIGNIIVIVVGCLTHTYKLYAYLPATPRIIEINLPDNITYTAYLLVFLLIPFVCFVISSKKSFKSTYLSKLIVLISYMSLFAVGIVFAYGLMLGGFAERKHVYKYLILDERWNPNMIVIYGYSMLVSAVVYLFMRYGMKKPVFSSELIQDNSPLKFNLFFGAILYGIGWGLGGLRPASSIKIMFYWGLSCLIGMKTAHKLFQPTPIQLAQQNKQ